MPCCAVLCCAVLCCAVPSQLSPPRGLALLLPGSLGFRGMQGIMASDTLAGLNTAISALIVAASIAAGLLIAIPGLITTAIGLILWLPFVRSRIAARLERAARRLSPPEGMGGFA